MIDWDARIAELAATLERDYAMSDREAVEILLAALVNCPRTPSTWLVLETNWYARRCTDAWFSFGESWTPETLPRLRARSPWREIEAEINQWLENPSDDHLFVEPDYERYPRFHRLTQARYLLQRTLRIRARSKRIGEPLYSLDKYAQERRADELAAATRFVLEDRAQARPTDLPRFLEPPDYLYHVELIQRLAPWYEDWNTLVRSFALIAVRRAYLFGRTETNAEDNAAMARIARDSVPPWISKALWVLLDGVAEPHPL